MVTTGDANASFNKWASGGKSKRRGGKPNRSTFGSAGRQNPLVSPVAGAKRASAAGGGGGQSAAAAATSSSQRRGRARGDDGGGYSGDGYEQVRQGRWLWAGVCGCRALPLVSLNKGGPWCVFLSVYVVSCVECCMLYAVCRVLCVVCCVCL